MSCSSTFPLPEEKETVLVIHGEPNVTKNFAMSAILHGINAKRFCYYIGNSDGSFDDLTAFDGCTFRADFNDFLIPKNAESAEATVQRLQEVARKTNPALIVVELPGSCTPYEIVNILGYLQDLRVRLRSTCLLLANEESRNDSVISDRLSEFYKLKVYQAFRWGLRNERGENVISFVTNGKRLSRVS